MSCVLEADPPRNDRFRYTFRPAARKEVLKRLLTENQRRWAAELQATTADAPTMKTGRRNSGDDEANIELF